MAKKSKILSCAVAFALTGFLGGVSAADVYELNPVVVTAQRIEKQELDVPASTTVVTEKDFKNKGYTTVSDVLEQTVGIDAYTYFPGGNDMGSSQSRTYIRGLDKGTLVLVNGAPINIMNYSSTSGIPIDAVEKIEIIKGSNSVLYGAEAMGGVVNIITKKGGEPKTTFKLTGGNYVSGYQLGQQGEKYTVFYDKQYIDELREASRTFPESTKARKTGKSHKDSIYGSVEFTNNLSLNFSHMKMRQDLWNNMQVVNGKRTDIIADGAKYEYETKKNNINLIYDDKDSEFRSILAYNDRVSSSRGVNYKNQKIDKYSFSGGSNYRVYGMTFDNQKAWHFNKGRDSLVSGVTYKYEHYKEKIKKDNKIGRKSYSLYSSYSHEFNDELTGIFGARGEFVQGNGWDKKQNVFLPQIQFLYKLNDSWSLYTNIGKSFDMPAINSKYYSAKLKNWDVKPQSGWTYEIGSKYIHGKDTLKVALFHMRIKDKFQWVKESDLLPGGNKDINVQVNGGDFRNTGIEAEYQHSINVNWKFNMGISVSNPEIKEKKTEVWKQEAAKFQGNAGLEFHKNKFRAGLNYFLLADREPAYYNNKGKKAGDKWDHAIPNKSLLNATFIYEPNHRQEIALNLYNLLDRHNPINKSENWDLPFNWTLSYRYSF